MSQTHYGKPFLNGKKLMFVMVFVVETIRMYVMVSIVFFFSRVASSIYLSNDDFPKKRFWFCQILRSSWYNYAPEI